MKNENGGRFSVAIGCDIKFYSWPVKPYRICGLAHRVITRESPMV